MIKELQPVEPSDITSSQVLEFERQLMEKHCSDGKPGLSNEEIRDHADPKLLEFYTTFIAKFPGYEGPKTFQGYFAFNVTIFQIFFDNILKILGVPGYKRKDDYPASRVLYDRLEPNEWILFYGTYAFFSTSDLIPHKQFFLQEVARVFKNLEVNFEADDFALDVISESSSEEGEKIFLYQIYVPFSENCEERKES